MSIRKLGGAALLGLMALLAGSASTQAGDRYRYDGRHGGYYWSQEPYWHGRGYRPYRYGYRGPRYYYRARPYYFVRPYYDYAYGYDPYYYGDPPPAYYYGPGYCRPRARVGLFFGW